MSDINVYVELVTSYGYSADDSMFVPDYTDEYYSSGVSDSDGMPINTGNLVWWADKSGSYEVVDINTEKGLIQVEGTKCGDLWWVAPVDVNLI